MISHFWKRRRDPSSEESEEGGGCRSTIMRLLLEEREATSWAVARPMPEEPPVMRTVLEVREVRELGSTVKTDIMGGWLRRDVCEYSWSSGWHPVLKAIAKGCLSTGVRKDKESTECVSK